jgi:two-component system sensor histidine kinase UhpB
MISELSDCENTSSHDALEALAFELGNRFGIVIGIDSPGEAELAPHQRDDVLRIVREAIANAVRHGGARSISVALRRSPEGVVVRIRDDGRGIAQATPGAYREGFGLRSMRERASALGGYLTVRERTRGGTELEVVMP